jgi:hypothetical protein
VDRGFKDADLSNTRTEAEIAALLGPPGDYSTREQGYEGRLIGPLPTGRRVEWKDDYALVEVYFSPDGYLNSMSVLTPSPDRRSWFERLRDLWD